MTKIIDYKVVERRSPHDLELYVKQALLQGWQPQGGVCVTHSGLDKQLPFFTQVLVKYQRPEASGNPS